jgi:hypothetical protein
LDIIGRTLAILALTAGAVFGSPLHGQAAVVKQNVNLRVGASTSTAIVELLHPGDELTILDPVERSSLSRDAATIR